MVKDKLLTVREVAEFLKVQPTTIYDYVSSGKMKAIRMGGKYGNIRITEQELNEFLGVNNDRTVRTPLDNRTAQ